MTKTEILLPKDLLMRSMNQLQPTPVLLPGKSHGRRSLEGCSPWGHYKLDTTERLHVHLLLSCIGEGTGNPLLCSCLENPRDGGAWWAVVYGVSQSWTWLKRLSSNSSMNQLFSLLNKHLLSFNPVLGSWTNFFLVRLVSLKEIRIPQRNRETH